MVSTVSSASQFAINKKILTLQCCQSNGSKLSQKICKEVGYYNVYNLQEVRQQILFISIDWFSRTMSGSVRYCNRCVLVKPDRAHHCSICSRCVLKMDHHCPWVNNCVCFFNYKFFMLFLGYALFYCLFIMATCLPYFIKFWKVYSSFCYFIFFWCVNSFRPLLILTALFVIGFFCR